MHEQLSDVHQIIRSYNGVARYLSTHFQQKCGRPCEWLTVGLPYSYHNLYLYLICQWQLPVWYCSQSTAEDAQKRVHIYIYIHMHYKEKSNYIYLHLHMLPVSIKLQYRKSFAFYPCISCLLYHQVHFMYADNLNSIASNCTDFITQEKVFHA